MLIHQALGRVIIGGVSQDLSTRPGCLAQSKEWIMFCANLRGEKVQKLIIQDRAVLLTNLLADYANQFKLTLHRVMNMARNSSEFSKRLINSELNKDGLEKCVEFISVRDDEKKYSELRGLEMLAEASFSLE